MAGSIHLELFPPLLLKAFGKRWFERGTISMYFLNATTDREAVRAFLKEPPLVATDAEVEIWIERDDGMRVAEGTRPSEAPKSQPHCYAVRSIDSIRVSYGSSAGLKSATASRNATPS